MPAPIFCSSGELSPGISPRNLETLSLLDLRKQFPISQDYHGPTTFQVWSEVDNRGVFPFQAQAGQPETYSGISTQGAKISWNVRYPNGGQSNPVSANITDFVASHPYPHVLNQEEDPTQYWAAVKRYQDTVKSEMAFHIDAALAMAEEDKRFGTPIFPLAFWGAKPIGHLLSQGFRIPGEQFMTAQIKRIPLTDGRLIIAAGGIQFPQAVHQGKEILPVYLDDCNATWATMRFEQGLLKLVQAKIRGVFCGSVVGTRHPFNEEFLNAEVPTRVSISAACNRLGSNAYLLNPDGTMKVGDMGLIVNADAPGQILDHKRFGIQTGAHQLYQAFA